MTYDVVAYSGKNILEGDIELIQDFIEEAVEHLDASEAHLLVIENDPKETEALNAVFRGFHTIKGLAGFIEMEHIKDLAHKAENLLDMARRDELELVGTNMDLVFESVDMMKRLIEGVGAAMSGNGLLATEGALPTLMAACPCPVHVHRAEAEGVRVVTGLSKSDLVSHDSGDKVKVGELEIELLHTPGHTPGSQCFRVRATQHEPGGALVAGDTLFLQGCGRVDLPGGDPDQMYETLSRRLSDLPGDTVLLPGHAYGGERATMDEVRATNSTLRISSLAEFRWRMGG